MGRVDLITHIQHTIRMKNNFNYAIEDLKEELMYINMPEATEDHWLVSANDSMVEKLESKYEDNPEEEFYANQQGLTMSPNFVYNANTGETICII